MVVVVVVCREGEKEKKGRSGSEHARFTPTAKIPRTSTLHISGYMYVYIHVSEP